MSCFTVPQSATVLPHVGKQLHEHATCKQGVERGQLTMLSASSRVSQPSFVLSCVKSSSSGFTRENVILKATTAGPAFRSIHATLVAHPFGRTEGARRKSKRAPLRRPLLQCVPVCGTVEEGMGLLVKTGHRIQELFPLMLFTFGKATDWLTKPLQGPLKEFLGNTFLDLAMAAGGLIISIIATGAWKSLPFLRNIAKEVEEVKAPFVVPADYFSREAEENLLLAMLEGDPRDVMLLTGPPSSGKTATIARVLQRREERKEVSKADDAPGSVTRTVAGAGIYINMRFGDFLGSIQMGCELSGQFRNYIESLSGIADAEVRRVLGKEDQVRIGVQVLKALKLTKRKPPEEVTRWIDSLEKSQVGCEGIETAVKKIESILRRLRPGLGEGTKAQVNRRGGQQMLRISDTVEERLLAPVICIDAAEELMRWPDPASLATLLRFLVGISSERRQAHVVLVTSDAKMQAWLEEKVGAHLVTMQVLGDLPQPAAARYFEGARRARLGDAADDVTGDVSFEEVWAVAGGRIALMQRLLERGRASGNLRTALQAERAASKDRLSRALAGISKSDLDSLRNDVQNGMLSLKFDKVEPLLKAGILRKTPWSELGMGIADENHSEDGGLQFVFPADSVILAELLQDHPKSGIKDTGGGHSKIETSPIVESEKAESENGRSRGGRKSFFEV